MKHLITTILILTISGIALFGQPSSMILRYEKVTEYVFDEKSQNYIPTDTIEFSGAISVDHVKVFIKGYNNKPDKTLNISSQEKEEGTNRDLYYCEMNGEKYAIAISPDKEYLTQIGVNDKYIYKLQPAKEVNIDELINSIKENPDTTSKVIYIGISLDQKPIFGDAKSFEEGEELLNEYLSNELKKYNKIKAGTAYISIVISNKGKVEDVKLLYGKNEEFNNAAIEIVKNLPNWQAGKQRGVYVNASYTIEVKK